MYSKRGVYIADINTYANRTGAMWTISSEMAAEEAVPSLACAESLMSFAVLPGRVMGPGARGSLTGGLSVAEFLKEKH